MAVELQAAGDVSATQQQMDFPMREILDSVATEYHLNSAADLREAVII